MYMSTKSIISHDFMAEVLNSYLVPLVFGAKLYGPARFPEWRAYASLDEDHCLYIPCPGTRNKYYVLKRNISFNSQEKNLVKILCAGLLAEDIREASNYHKKVMSVVEMSIANLLSPGDAQTLYEMIQIYSKYSDHMPIENSHALGLMPNEESSKDAMHYEAVLNSQMAKVMGYGSDSIITIGRGGLVTGIESLESLNYSREEGNIFAPAETVKLANWTKSQGRVAISLSPKGDILLFRKKELVFAKRRCFWRSFPHNYLNGSNERMQGTREAIHTHKALYLSLLDLSLSRTKTSIGIIDSNKSHEILNKLVPGNTLFDAPDISPDTAVLKAMVKDKKYYQLSREIRHKLAQLDGSLIIDNEGKILAAGTPIFFGSQRIYDESSVAKTLSSAKNCWGLHVSPCGLVEVFHEAKFQGSFG